MKDANAASAAAADEVKPVASTPLHVEQLRQLLLTVYTATRKDSDFEALLSAYNDAPLELIDELYGVVAGDARTRSTVPWRTYKHLASFLADTGRRAEASTFCELWAQSHSDVECWYISAVLACQQGDFARWRHCYQQAESCGATRQSLLILEIGALLTFSDGRGAVDRSRELLSALLPGESDPLARIVLEEAAVRNRDAILLLEVDRRFPLDPPSGSLHESQIRHLLRQSLLRLLLTSARKT